MSIFWHSTLFTLLYRVMGSLQGRLSVFLCITYKSKCSFMKYNVNIAFTKFGVIFSVCVSACVCCLWKIQTCRYICQSIWAGVTSTPHLSASVGSPSAAPSSLFWLEQRTEEDSINLEILSTYSGGNVSSTKSDGSAAATSATASDSVHSLDRRTFAIVGLTDGSVKNLRHETRKYKNLHQNTPHAIRPGSV